MSENEEKILAAAISGFTEIHHVAATMSTTHYGKLIKAINQLKDLSLEHKEGMKRLKEILGKNGNPT